MAVYYVQEELKYNKNKFNIIRSLCMKIKKRIQRSKIYFSHSFRIMLYQTLSEEYLNLMNKNRIKLNDKNLDVLKKLALRKNSAVQEYLKKDLVNVIDSFKESEDKSSPAEKKIWVLWLQGSDNVPEIVKLCINSIIKNKSECEVNLLDESNLAEYIDIPKYILDFYKEGNISNAHFSDIIRIMLLKKYGGIWLDATCLVTRPIPMNILEFTTYNAKGIAEFPFSSYWFELDHWEGYFLSGKKNDLFYIFMENMLFEYWKTHTSLVDYLLINHFAKIGRDLIPKIKKCYESIPNNNQKIEQLLFELKNVYTEKWRNDFFSNDTYIYKLNRRKHYPTNTLSGRMTVYGWLLSEFEKNK
jgi:hypothetical protein